MLPKVEGSVRRPLRRLVTTKRVYRMPNSHADLDPEAKLLGQGYLVCGTRSVWTSKEECGGGGGNRWELPMGSGQVLREIAGGAGQVAGSQVDAGERLD